MSIKLEMTDPTCDSYGISKNRTTRRGNQHYRYRDCGRQFVEYPHWNPKGKDAFTLVSLLLMEKILLAGTARAAHVSDSWLQSYANDKCGAVPQHIKVTPELPGNLSVQID